jgi:L-alanine-DL-glutamate epimerase-like enolase superfamily enzyme
MTSWAVGALDCAVWDLHARAEGCPVAALLSAAGHRASVPAYASWLRLDVDAAPNTDSISRVASEGWRFTKWGLRPNPRLDVEDDAHRLAMLVKGVAEVAGAPAAFDALWAWDQALTLRFSEVVDQAGLVWLEEPLSTYNLPCYAALAASGPSVALGERLHLGDDPTGLLRLTGLGAFTLDVVGCGGLTTATRLTEQARAAGVPVYPHGRSLVPAVHLAAAFPDAVAAVEYQVQWEPRRQQLFTETMPCDGGQVLVPVAPGLGPVPRRR